MSAATIKVRSSQPDAPAQLRDVFARRLWWHLANEIYPKYSRGFTFDPPQWAFPAFPAGVFIVSLGERSLIPEGPPPMEKLVLWVVRNLDLLSRSGHFVGHWWNTADRLWYLDVSIAIIGVDHALWFARRHRRRSLYYPAEDIALEVDNASALAAHPNSNAKADPEQVNRHTQSTQL